MNSDQSNFQGSAILVICDDMQQRHDLQTVLNFIGEKVVSGSSSSWRHEATECALHPQQFSAAIIAESSGSQLERVIQALCDWEA
ncbi:MAG: hypothetical protein CMQ16_07730, partial [Gammaproteobacteria bacterium]|nr:hypothetical protein [Gammaproteobacteria bacterium]